MAIRSRPTFPASMIADTNFLSGLYRERQSASPGPATEFLRRHRRRPLWTTIISVGELAVMVPPPSLWLFLSRWRVLRLDATAALEAARIDRELIAQGGRLGENDNWIAGIACVTRQPVISRDTAFDRVRGLRRLEY